MITTDIPGDKVDNHRVQISVGQKKRSMIFAGALYNYATLSKTYSMKHLYLFYG